MAINDYTREVYWLDSLAKIFKVKHKKESDLKLEDLTDARITQWAREIVGVQDDPTRKESYFKKQAPSLKGNHT